MYYYYRYNNHYQYNHHHRDGRSEIIWTNPICSNFITFVPVPNNRQLNIFLCSVYAVLPSPFGSFQIHLFGAFRCHSPVAASAFPLPLLMLRTELNKLLITDGVTPSLYSNHVVRLCP
jgi:hypothetical protein